MEEQQTKKMKQRLLYMNDFGKIMKMKEEIEKIQNEIKEKNSDLKYLNSKCKKMKQFLKFLKEIKKIKKRIIEINVHDVPELKTHGKRFREFLWSLFSKELTAKKIDKENFSKDWKKMYKIVFKEIEKFNEKGLLIRTTFGIKHTTFNSIYKQSLKNEKEFIESNPVFLWLKILVEMSVLVGLQNEGKVYDDRPDDNDEMGMKNLFGESDSSESDSDGEMGLGLFG